MLETTSFARVFFLPVLVCVAHSSEEGEFETKFEVDGSTPPAARAMLERYVKPSGAGLQTSVAAQIKAFVDDFNAM